MEIPDILTAGLRDRTTLRNNRIPQLWSRFLDLMPQIPGQIPHGRGFGICESCGEGNTLYTMNDDLLFSEVVSVEVSSMSVLPPPLVYKTIPGGKYAVFTHTGSLKSLLPYLSVYLGHLVPDCPGEVGRQGGFLSCMMSGSWDLIILTAGLTFTFRSGNPYQSHNPYRASSVWALLLFFP